MFDFVTKNVEELMTYTFIDDLLQDYSIDLEVLRRDTNLYSISMLQHKGVFHFSESFFGNLNNAEETVKFNDFLLRAKDNNSSLVVTPEYSCPWNSIKYVLNDAERLPANGKLWVLGCESITPDEALNFQNTYNETKDIEVVFSDTINNAPGGVLLDPCVYLFKAQNPLGQEKVIVLLQFKVQHMGAQISPLEQQKLIPGQHLFILRNSPDSINLTTVICSDAMRFDGREIYPNAPGQWDIQPFIVLSIQMNPKPSHDEFRNFRRNILKTSNKDVISLNWSSDGKSSDNLNFFNEYSKSNISIRTTQIENNTRTEENQINDNHKKGLYYTRLKPYRHCFYFTPEVEFFYLRMRKPAEGLGPNPANRRRGPELHNIYEYDELLETFAELEGADDGYQNFIESIQIQSQNLQNDALSILDKERLITLTTGEISKVRPGINWYAVNALKSFLMDDTEIISRFTVTFDGNGRNYRVVQLGRIEDLNVNVLPNADFYPDILASFKGNCSEVMFLNQNGTKYNYNLVTDDNQFATVAYLGLSSDVEAKVMLNQLIKLFPSEDLDNKRIVVWYKPSMVINSYDNVATDRPKYTSTEQTDLTSITRE